MNYTNEQREVLAMQLVPFLNDLEAQGRGVQFVASTATTQKEAITFSDLMSLSSSELQALEQLMLKAKAAKKVKEKSAKYDTTSGPKYAITDGPSRLKYTITDKVDGQNEYNGDNTNNIIL